MAKRLPSGEDMSLPKCIVSKGLLSSIEEVRFLP